MWITSCVRAGQREVTRSNVKCMYCNKHVQLKRALVILLDFLGLPHNASALLKVSHPPTTFSLFLFDQQEEIFNKRVMHRLFFFFFQHVPSLLLVCPPAVDEQGPQLHTGLFCFFPPTTRSIESITELHPHIQSS